jgi:hypothetical protein
MSFRLPATMLRTSLRTPTRQVLQRRLASTEPEGITFSSKASRPTPKYEVPEAGRAYMATNRSGSPPNVAVTPPAVRYVDGVKQEESFAGPSRPRMVYDRPKEARPLPQLKVSPGPIHNRQSGKNADSKSSRSQTGSCVGGSLARSFRRYESSPWTAISTLQTPPWAH